MAKPNYDFVGWATRYNVHCSDGRTILPGAFADDDGITVPLVWNHQHNEPENVLGHAMLKDCGDDGVRAYCTFNDTEGGILGKKLVQHGDISALSIYANRLKQKASSPTTADVIHGAIREVSLVLASANPGAYIDMDSVMAHSDDDGDVAIIYSGEDGLDYFEHADESEEEDDMAKEKTVDDVLGSINEKLDDDEKEVLVNLMENIVQDAIDEDEDEDDYDDEEDEIITSVEKPEISWNENVVTLSCITPGADIYYYTLSDNYSKGWTKYNKAFYISEDTYVECYSIYNEIRSATPNNWANIPYIGEITPDCPVITRNENTNTVTITCATSGATIWYKINKSGSWIEYTGQISVSNHDDVYSYATNRRRASDIVKNDAPDPILIPDVPEISCSANIVTITCDTEGASIWYRQYNSTY